MICCICENQFDEIEEVQIGNINYQTFGGHNPAPVKDEGRCCTKCNFGVVLPARFEMTIKTETDEETI